MEVIVLYQVSCTLPGRVVGRKGWSVIIFCQINCTLSSSRPATYSGLYSLQVLQRVTNPWWLSSMNVENHHGVIAETWSQNVVEFRVIRAL